MSVTFTLVLDKSLQVNVLCETVSVGELSHVSELELSISAPVSVSLPFPTSRVCAGSAVLQLGVGLTLSCIFTDVGQVEELL